MTLTIARRIALAIILFTGFTGLVYEVTWHVYLANLLGSHAKASCLILATFLGGLAIGYAIFGRYSRGLSPRRAVRMCATVEFLIGVWALLFPALYRAVWHGLFVESQPTLFVFDELILTTFFIGPPTILMGGTLPLLTQGLSLNTAESAKFHARLYAVNTAGAFVGALLAGFILIPLLGLALTLSSAGLLNLAAGAGLLFVSRRMLGSSEAPASEAAASESPTRSPNADPLEELNQGDKTKDPASVDVLPFKVSVIWAFLAGANAITVQVLLMRVMGLVIGSSEYAFATIVGTFIMLLAWGAAREGRVGRPRTPLWLNQSLVIVGLIAVYLLIPWGPYAAHIVRVSLTSIPPNFYVYHLLVLTAWALLLAIPVAAMGATLPLLFAATQRDRASLGGAVGYVYGFNTAGCVIGAVVGGYAALSVLNIDQVFRLCIGLAIVPLLMISHMQPFNRRKAAAVALILILVTVSLADWRKEIFAVGTFRLRQLRAGSLKGAGEFYKSFTGGQKLLAYRDDPNTTVAVVESGAARSININGKSDGSTRGGDRVTTKLLAHLPALLQSSQSRSAAVVGFGTGVTVGSLALYDSLAKIQILEISAAVRRFSPLFDRDNHAASQSSKIEWHVQDAYRFLLTASERYAVIISEPSNPWVAGVERLYSREFYEIVRKKLAPGGIYAQWFHTYSLSNSTFEVVLKTFRSSFAHVHILGRGGDLILLGSNEEIAAVSLDLARARFRTRIISQDLADIGYRSFEALLADELWIPSDVGFDAPIHSLTAPTLAYRAGYDFFLDATAAPSHYSEDLRRRKSVNHEIRRSLLRRFAAASPGTIGPQRMAQLLCRSEQPQFSQGWQRYPFTCRAALVAAAVAGVLPATPLTPQNEIAAIRGLIKQPDAEFSPLPPVLNQVIAVLLFLQTHGAGFLDLEPARLEIFTAACRDPAADTVKRDQCRDLLQNII